MLNQIVLVGRLVADPKIQKVDNGKTVSNVTIAVPRSFKNANGEYDTDFLNCVLWDSVAKSAAEYCHKGDIVGIKGRMQSDVVEKEDGTKNYYTNVVAERVTFLQSNREREEKEAKEKIPKVKEKDKDIER